MAVVGACEAREQLDSVLSDLYDFGDDFVARDETVRECGQSDGRPEEKGCEIVTGGVEDQRPAACSKRGKKQVSMFFASIKEELCSRAESPAGSSSSASEPSTIQVVSFRSRNDKKRSRDEREVHPEVLTQKPIDEPEDDNDLEFNFEKARLEVHKFGITGYKKEKQRKFEAERAIMLGARPPKREYVNYKLYQAEKKEKDQKRKEDIQEAGSKKQKQGKKERRSRKTKGSGTAPSGQLGQFRNGALFLSGKDIEKIKKSRVIK